MDPNELELVYTLNDSNKAEIIKNALEAEGIKCEIENEHQAGLTGIFEVALFVRVADADRARKLIGSHEQPE